MWQLQPSAGPDGRVPHSSQSHRDEWDLNIQIRHDSALAFALQCQRRDIYQPRPKAYVELGKKTKG